jgi:alkanesulfonate monooxygenase SsuD/methylene tetrahydromethanopterin reductase-like flavin-dependent oxidoreductase (luciferase family)
MSQINLRHGIFLPPFHPNEENPTQCLERDLDLIEWLDKLGFHEAWIGEHHSAGYEITTRSFPRPRSLSPSPPSAPGTSASALASSHCPITAR